MARPTPLIPPPCSDISLGDGRQLTIGGQLGRGSMATVYRGVYEGACGLRRAVAIKVFDTIASDEHDAVLSALTRAAQRSACVRHPNVVRVEDFGLAGPAQPYSVLELVEGRNLTKLLASFARRRERIPTDVALFVGSEIAEALAGARLAGTPEGTRVGVVHGDLSPCDVLLSWHGEVKVSDFEVAIAARAASSVRSVRALARRVSFLAPEVARGQLGDARSDVFSLGVILREMLVGPRFPSFVTEQQALGWAREGIVHSSIFEPQLPNALQCIVARALEKDPANRYPPAGALGYELRRVALAMGVGDGRSFLRSALARIFAEDTEDEPTGEVKLPTPLPRPSGVVDRFARLRGDAADPESGILPVADDASEDDPDGEAHGS
jgi:serine/threonine protein kinase